MNEPFIEEKIKIKDLLLWDENARFPDTYSDSNELELISYFLSNSDFKIESFLDEVIKDFDLPQLEKMVVWRDDEKNIVLEGNRRLTCYKLLNNPQIISEINSRLFNKIQNNENKPKIQDSFLIDCLVSTDKNQCYRFIDRKHSKNNNEVGWLEPERLNYSIRRGAENKKAKLKIAISNFVKELELPVDIKSQILGRGFVTNFFRVVATSPAINLYGLDIDENGSLIFSDIDFPEKLKVIIFNLVNKEDFSGKKIDSRELNKNPQIEKYLKSVKKKDSKKVDKEIESNTTKDIFGEESIKTQKGKKKLQILPKSTSRKYLVPNNCRIKIKAEKINNIYRELKDDLLLTDSNSSVPNAVGVLFRVFLEISLDYYAEKKGGHLFKSSETISKKIPFVVNLLKEKGYDKKTFKSIMKVGSATSENSYLSIHNFHEYVHSTTVQPSSGELKAKWDNLQPFFELLWDDINQK